MNRVAVFVVAAIGVFAPSAIAQAPKEAPPAEQAATKTYLREAAIADMFAIESGKIALEQAGREEVRQFARMAVADRSDRLRKLKDLISSAQLDSQAPKAVDKVQEEKLDDLRKAEGTALDRNYLDMQIKSTETALTLHSTYARGAQDGPLKTYATETAATLERHLAQLRGLADLAPARS